jgi:hypothetical protein
VSAYADLALLVIKRDALQHQHDWWNGELKKAMTAVEELTAVCGALAERIDEHDAAIESLRPPSLARTPATAHPHTSASRASAQGPTPASVPQGGGR